MPSRGQSYVDSTRGTYTLLGWWCQCYGWSVYILLFYMCCISLTRLTTIWKFLHNFKVIIEWFFAWVSSYNFTFIFNLTHFWRNTVNLTKSYWLIMIKFLIVQFFSTVFLCCVCCFSVCRCIYSDGGDLCLDTKCHSFSGGGSRWITVEPVWFEGPNCWQRNH